MLLEVAERRLRLKSDELHYHEGAHEAIGGHHCVLVSDQRYDRVLQFAEVIYATAEPVLEVVDGDVTIWIPFELALHLKVLVGAVEKVVREQQRQPGNGALRCIIGVNAGCPDDIPACGTAAKGS